MQTNTLPMDIQTDQLIPTWFGVGGRAHRLAKPGTIEELRECLRLDAKLKVLGDGANLLVADAGVSELVVALTGGTFASVEFTPTEGGGATLRAGAGVNLPKLINETVRQGLAGLEGLGGIPATVGGALVMNAGGQFAQTGDCVQAVHTIDRTGVERSFKRTQITFDYRRTLLGTDGPRGPAGAATGLIVTAVEFRLRKADPAALRKRLLEVMEYKKRTQPLSDRSAGCVFKNPVITADLPGVAVAGSRVSAGMLIDRAGCKGMSVGRAEVSTTHGNFFIAKPGATANEVIELIRGVRAKVQAAFGVSLEPEVAIWGQEL